MTLVKLNQKPFERTLNSLFEDIFQQFPSRYAQDDWSHAAQLGRYPVNIRESEKAWTLDLVAPGFEKSDFQIKLENGLLTISAEKKDENKQEQEKLVRKEFSFRSFSRSFTVDEKIDAASITAKYENGVLVVSLPRKEEPKANPHQITVQ
jgi:HSP20 family protein